MNRQRAVAWARVRPLVRCSLLVPIFPLVLGACGRGAERRAASAAGPTSRKAGTTAEASRPAIWVVNASLVDTRLYKIDPASGKVAGSVQLGGLPRGVAAGAGAVWVTDYSNDKVLEIDPASVQVESSLSVDDAPTAIVTGGGAVWAISSNAGVLTAIDPASDRIRDTLEITNSLLTGLAYGAGGVWIPSVDFLVTRVDPAQVKVAASIRVTGNPSSIAVAGGKVWVLNLLFRQLLEIDPATNKATKLDLPDGGRMLSSDGRTLWLAGDGGTLTKIDTSSGKPALSFKVPGEISGMCVTGDALWISVGQRNEVLDVDPQSGKTRATIAIAGGPGALAYGP